jgi:hypothetical protein
MNKEKIARTGRVQTWIDDPTSRLPVSCTVFVVEDEMEGPNGIEASWRFASHALRFGAGCAIHLSKLRPRGTETIKGSDKLVASGPVSFGKIYSTLNEILRRGGTYRNGAIVLHLSLEHPDILEFVNVSRAELPWVKRCVNLTTHMWGQATPEVKLAILDGIRRGDIWLMKSRVDARGNRIYGNVCLEVLLPSRGTCLLQHVNLGACDIEDIEPAFVAGMSELCALHSKTGVGQSGEYLSPEVDRQVGLGMLGLANLLGRHGVTYQEFGNALEDLNKGNPYERTGAHLIAIQLQRGIASSAQVARTAGMERAFAIAPTASCSYRYADADGYTTTPEIAPPISRTVDRDSSTFGVQSFDYGPNVEIAAEVGWDAYKKAVDNIVLMLDKTGLFHGYSFNSWSDVVTYNEAFIDDWMASPQTSLYYALQVSPDTQRKDDALSALDEDFHDLFGFDTDEPITDDTHCVSCAE